MPTGVAGEEPVEPAQEEARAGQQHEREGDFGDDQGVAQPVMGAAGGGAARALLEGFVDVRARGKPGGQYAKHEAGDERREKGEHERA